MNRSFICGLLNVAKFPYHFYYGRRACSSKRCSVRVTLCGALGQVGQPLSLLLKQDPEITELCLYDCKRTKAYAMELNLIDTNCRVIGTDGFGKEREVFADTDIVVIVAANPQASCMDYCEMFQENKGIICRTANIIAKHCPKAFVAVVTHPVNSFVPLLSEQLRIHGVHDARKVFGVTTLDSVRASTFIAERLKLSADKLDVPVLAGGFGKTIVPVISATTPHVKVCHEDVEAVIKAVQNAHEEVVKTRRCCRGPAHSAAFAVARFVGALARAQRGIPNIVESSFVRSNVVDDLRYMSTRLLLGPDGVQRNLGLPCMSLYEHDKLVEAIELLRDNIYLGEIEAGVDYSIKCETRTSDLCR